MIPREFRDTINSKFILSNGARIAAVGSSTTNFNHSWDGTYIVAGLGSSRAGSLVSSRYMSPRWDFRVWRDANNSRGYTGDNYGYGGYTISQLSTYVDDIIAANKYNACIVQLGANDLNNGSRASTIVTAVTTEVNKLLAANIRVFLRSVGPRAASGVVNSTNAVTAGDILYRTRREVNLGLKALADSSQYIVFVDPTSVICDSTSSDQATITNGSADGLHLSSVAAIGYEAAYIQGVLDAHIAPGSWQTLSPSASGNQYGNGTLTGTGGTAGTGASGSIPDQVRVGRISGTATGVCSVVQDPNEGNALRTIFTSTSGESLFRCSFTSTPSTSGIPGPSNPVSSLDGLWVRGSANVFIREGGSILNYVELRNETRTSNTGSSTGGCRTTIGASDVAIGSQIDGRLMTLITEPLLVPTGTTFLSLELFTDFTGSGTVCVDVSNVRVSTVGAPSS